MASRDEMTFREARDLGRKLFGSRANMFLQAGLFHVGTFLDDEEKKPPMRREQEIYGVGETLGEAFRFFLGAERVYSIPGVQPGAKKPDGYKPRTDRYGRILGWESASGVFYQGPFPGRRAHA